MYGSRGAPPCPARPHLGPPRPLCWVQVKVTEHSQLKSALQAQARKQTGSLAVRDLSDLVRPDQLVDTENLCSLLVVVGKSAKSDWLKNYEKLSDFVVGGGGGSGEWVGWGVEGGLRGSQGAPGWWAWWAGRAGGSCVWDAAARWWWWWW